MIQVAMAGHRLFALAPNEWEPGAAVMPPVASRSRYFSKEEANLTMIRLYTSPIRAAWASVCWKHSSNQPWIVKVEVTTDLLVYRRSASSEVYWAAGIPDKNVVGAAKWFHWSTAWPNEIPDHILPIQDFLDEKSGS